MVGLSMKAFGIFSAIKQFAAASIITDSSIDDWMTERLSVVDERLDLNTPYKTGRLRGSIDISYSNKVGVIRSDVPYAAKVHDRTAREIGAKGKFFIDRAVQYAFNEDAQGLLSKQISTRVTRAG